MAKKEVEEAPAAEAVPEKDDRDVWLDKRLLQFARDMNLIGQQHYDQECERLGWK